MGVRINSFGGPIAWFFRKNFSYYASGMILPLFASKYERDTKSFINWFNHQPRTPLFHNICIETVNRCNGVCEFCPANKNDEKRPFKKMSEDMFYGIIRGLQEINWKGTMYLCVNNEPFIDKRILNFAKYAKDNLEDVYISLISNGTLLGIKKMEAMVGLVDKITINDYSADYKIGASYREIYTHIRKNSEKFSRMEVIINRRYSKEILSTKGGSAPNKLKKSKRVIQPCVYPFLDLVIFPDGKVGVCCNDNEEQSEFGDLTKSSLTEIWENERFKEVRRKMAQGRMNVPFCKNCDVIDAGEREKYIKSLRL